MKQKIPIDELELYLNILKSEDFEYINNCKYSEIADIIRKRFNVKCSERDVFLIHEPTLQEEIIDVQEHYKLLSNA